MGDVELNNTAKHSHHAPSATSRIRKTYGHTSHARQFWSSIEMKVQKILLSVKDQLNTGHSLLIVRGLGLGPRSVEVRMRFTSPHKPANSKQYEHARTHPAVFHRVWIWVGYVGELIV